MSLFFSSRIGLVVVLMATACASEAAKDPSYVLVELVPTQSSAGTPGAAQIVVSNAAGTITTLCVNLQGDADKPTASFVLKREPTKSASERVQVVVSAYQALSGQDTVEPGKEFACPASVGAPMTPAQTIELDFCEAETRRLVFHVGATCDCAADMDAGMDDAGGADAGPSSCACGADLTCGAGLTTDGKSCGASTCCARSISTACALDL